MQHEIRQNRAIVAKNLFQKAAVYSLRPFLAKLRNDEYIYCITAMKQLLNFLAFGNINYKSIRDIDSPFNQG